jgi:AraC-like DNA-binding protein
MERILPLGTMELNFNLSHESYLIRYPSEGLRPHTPGQAMLSGPRSEYFLIDTSKPATLLSVWFKPGGALPFFGIPASELHNLHIPLRNLWGSVTDEICQALHQASTAQTRFQILEGFLQTRLNRNQPRHGAVAYTLMHLGCSPDIRSIVDQIGLSATRLIQVFKDDIGLSPKLFSQVQRFQHAVHRIAHDPNPDWTDLALSCGYYDQSHLVNSFQRFAGIPPTAYLPQDRDHPSNLAAG